MLSAAPLTGKSLPAVEAIKAVALTKLSRRGASNTTRAVAQPREGPFVAVQGRQVVYITAAAAAEREAAYTALIDDDVPCAGLDRRGPGRAGSRHW